MDLPIVFYRKDKPDRHAWAKYLVSNTKVKNNNNLISVVGRTGSGKTWTAISICEIMSKIDGVPFKIEHIVFSLKELMDLINSNKLVRGSKIVFDEPQISISAREFQSEANKVFNYLLSTFRHRNLTLFFCTPFESLLDKNTRKLFKARFSTEKIDKKNGTCRIKPRALEYVDFKEDPYTSRLVINTMKGSTRVDFWEIPKPSPEIIKEYEKKKRKFTDNLNKNITERLNRYDEKGKSMTGDAEKTPYGNKKVLGMPKTPKLTPAEILVYALNQKGLNPDQIAEKIGKSKRRVNTLIKIIQLKGVLLEK